MPRGSISILETSVPPGTCREVVLPILEAGRGMKVEADFGLAYSPERIFEGRSLADLEQNYPKIVAGFGPKSLKAVSALYSCVARKGVIELSSLEAAEAEKLFEGVYRDVNIALANELALVSEKLGIDFWEVQKAANSQPFSHLHRPGPGVGGACIPVYPVFVSEAARAHRSQGRDHRGIEEAQRRDAGRNCEEGSLLVRAKGKRVAVLGLAFRGDVADDRLSPTYVLLKELRRLKCDVRVHDPLVRKAQAEGFPILSDLGAALKGCDLVIVATDHSGYKGLDYEMVKKAAGSEPLVYDTRGILDRSKFPKGKLFVLGGPQ